MPISIAKMANNKAVVTFQEGEDAIHVTYFPARVTEKVLAQLQALAAPGDSNVLEEFAHYNETLVHLIDSWDVFEDDAQTVMFPLDPARLAELPLTFRAQVMQAIIGDIRPNTPAPQTANSEI